MPSILWAICSRSSEAPQRGQLRPDEGLAVFWINPIIGASCCVSRQQFVSDGPLFKSRGLISGETVCCDLTLMGQIVPAKSNCLCLCRGGGGGGHIFSGRQGEMGRRVSASVDQGKKSESCTERVLVTVCSVCACVHEKGEGL